LNEAYVWKLDDIVMNYGYDVILDLWGMFGCFEYKLADSRLDWNDR
jgi:hypothetical protein